VIVNYKCTLIVAHSTHRKKFSCLYYNKYNPSQEAPARKTVTIVRLISTTFFEYQSLRCSFNTMFFKEFSGFLLLTGYASASCLHGTSHLLRRTTSDGGVEVSKFGYTELKGPLHWAGLSMDNSACAIGTRQSPINMGMSKNSSCQCRSVAAILTIARFFYPYCS